MTVNDRKVDLAYLNKLRDQYYNNYHILLIKTY